MELNEKYRIVYDSENTILQFFEQREKTVKDKDKKLVGTGVFFEHTDNAYFPNLKSALTAFLNRCTWGLETAKEVLEELKRVELIIKNLK